MTDRLVPGVGRTSNGWATTTAHTTATVTRIGPATWLVTVTDDIFGRVYSSPTKRLAERKARRIMNRIDRRRAWANEERQVRP